MTHDQPDSSPRDPLRIGIIAPPWVTVPPLDYGGTELVVDLLAQGLVAAGHDVTLFATGDSTCPVPRRSLYPKALGTTAEPHAELAHVMQAYDVLQDVDVIHDHTLTGALWADRPEGGPPIVTTAHGELIDAVRPKYAAVASRVHIVAISHAQRLSAPEVPVAAVIHHGIDVASCPIGDGDGGYVLFLGRMNADKGAHRAILAARAAGRRIVLAAKMWEPAELRYFAEQVEPLLGPDATYVGSVGGPAKLELLGGAEALLNPIRWPEPFGLVMVEALACGTPVLAFAEGSAPEIVEHGRTGFLCADEADMAARLDHVASLDRASCRASASTWFSTERMVADHVALYRRIVAGHRAAALEDRDRVIDLTGQPAHVRVDPNRIAGPVAERGSGQPPVPTS